MLLALQHAAAVLGQPAKETRNNQMAGCGVTRRSFGLNYGAIVVSLPVGGRRWLSGAGSAASGEARMLWWSVPLLLLVPNAAAEQSPGPAVLLVRTTGASLSSGESWVGETAWHQQQIAVLCRQNALEEAPTAGTDRNIAAG